MVMTAWLLGGVVLTLEDDKNAMSLPGVILFPAQVFGAQKKWWVAKGLVVELAHSHVQSAWRSRGKNVWAAGLTAYCNYFSKKKKRKKEEAMG